MTLILALFACTGSGPSTDGIPPTDVADAVDADGDGFTEIDDCNDDDDRIHPDANERCNDIDDDCDGVVDDDPPNGTVYFADADDDGFGTGPEVRSCEPLDGHVVNNTDCDDADDTVNPLATETCDGIDRDCDGDVHAGATDGTTWYADEDGDGLGNTWTSETACEAPTGYVADDTDCDDADDTVGPPSIYFADDDGDGFGITGTTTEDCYAPWGYAEVDGDCDDTMDSVFPGAPERCDGLDNGCDGGSEPVACTDFEGSWTGGFQIGAVEQVGSFVVNDMQCGSGTVTLTVDLLADPVVSGTTTCSYPGGLGGFDGSQSGTFEADLWPDGTIEGTYVHEYGSFPDDSYSFDGDLSAGELSGSGGYYPSSFSAYAWDVDFSSSDLTAE